MNKLLYIRLKVTSFQGPKPTLKEEAQKVARLPGHLCFQPAVARSIVLSVQMRFTVASTVVVVLTHTDHTDFIDMLFQE